MVLSVFDDWYNVPFVKISQKQSKDSQNSKNHQIYNAAQTPLPCETSITCAWAVPTACRQWAGLTVCVYMDVHVSGSRSLPRAATLFYLLMMPAARLVCQRPSSNFPYFRTPFANFLLSRPNSVEYGNSNKTTTLLHSAVERVRVHSSKVELAAAGVHLVGMISSHASV